MKTIFLVKTEFSVPNQYAQTGLFWFSSGFSELMWLSLTPDFRLKPDFLFQIEMRKPNFWFLFDFSSLLKVDLTCAVCYANELFVGPAAKVWTSRAHSHNAQLTHSTRGRRRGEIREHKLDLVLLNWFLQLRLYFSIYRAKGTHTRYILPLPYSSTNYRPYQPYP
uniref:Uncharacterized protein n=1 Tax=Arundo donax TaxID=35708 RepID=A0A0A9GPN2_ARUDO